MFVGHFGLGLAGRAAAPRTSLGTWFLSVQLADLLWPIFLLLGWEHVRIVPANRLLPLDFYDYPITHSLLGELGWAALFAAVYLALRRRDPAPDRLRAALLLGAGVVSHWLLDLLVHVPDLPIVPGGRLYGLGLWKAPAIEIPLEAMIYVLGIIAYLRATRARDGIGRYGLLLLLLFLPAVWLGSLLGPPPPSVPGLARTMLSLWLVVLWAGWVDRHRESV